MYLFGLSVVAVADIVDLSLSLFVSAPLKAGISVIYPSSQCQGKAPAELESSYGISDLVFGLSVGFLEKQLKLSFNTGFSLIRWTRYDSSRFVTIVFVAVFFIHQFLALQGMLITANQSMLSVYYVRVHINLKFGR